MELRNLGLQIEGKTIWQNVNWQLALGEIWGLAGRSGSGKSLLLRCMAGLTPFTEGEMHIPPYRILPGEKKAWSFLRRHIGMVFQNSALFDDLTVFENIALYYLEKEKENPKILYSKVIAYMEALELDPSILSYYPRQLSGGMKRRVAIARSVIYQPRYLFYDEPSAELDDATSEKIAALILRLATPERLTVVVSHEKDFLALLSCKMAFLRQGTLYTGTGL
ncbi:MAG: ABC transporter ATP-binding protein [Bacteroidia bacterium]